MRATEVKVWQVSREWSIDAMELIEQPDPMPRSGQVVVRMRAASLNYRDLLTVEGKGGSFGLPLIPFSDGAGEIAALGEDVTRIAVGERVCPMFFQSWFDVLDAEGVSRTPSNLTFEEAATLPCAALTAWRALFEEAHVCPGDTVLVQGTRRSVDLCGTIRQACRCSRHRDLPRATTSSNGRKR